MTCVVVAAAELSGQSEELAAMVGTFQMEPNATATRPAPAGAVRVAARPAKTNPKMNPKNGASGRSRIALRPEELIPVDHDPAFKEF